MPFIQYNFYCIHAILSLLSHVYHYSHTVDIASVTGMRRDSNEKTAPKHGPALGVMSDNEAIDVFFAWTTWLIQTL